MSRCDVGLIGLAAMGRNLARNIAGKGFSVAVYNRTGQKTREFIEREARGLPVTGAESLAEFVALIKKPAAALLMVKAGQPVDETIAELAPLLSKGDLIADCGNSHFMDTERRAADLATKGILYMGVGVSGGEQGALTGPSIMPGGPEAAYRRLEPLFERIAARTKDGPCVTYLGPGGAGHYVKMVHNGIEYGDMQLIAETYDLMRTLGGMDTNALARAFERMADSELSSYLVEITAQILKERDPETGVPLLEVILDRAEQKGTGKWTVQNAMDLGVPVPTIAAAVGARDLSAMKDERVKAQKVLAAGTLESGALENIERAASAALYASRISLYAQGTSLLKAASAKYGYGFSLSETASIWKGGCIIRSALLDLIVAAFRKVPGPVNLLMDEDAASEIRSRLSHWRQMTALAAYRGVPCPAFSSSLAHYDGYRRANSAANLIQAQRDCFGAHTFERTDKKGHFHHQWKTGGPPYESG